MNCSFWKVSSLFAMDDKRRRGFLIIDMLLGAAISAVIFVAMIGFSMQMTDFFVGPGFITESSSHYSLSPSRIQDSRKQVMLSRIEELSSGSNSIILASGKLSPTWTSTNGKLEVPDSFSLLGINPSILQNPTLFRNSLIAAGLIFSNGYTAFFIGDEMEIIGILRVGSFDSTTHRIFSASISIGNSTPYDLQYAFAEPLAYAQSTPSYSMLNVNTGLSPCYDVTLPDPNDSFSARASKLNGTFSITRSALDGQHLTLPFYP